MELATLIFRRRHRHQVGKTVTEQVHPVSRFSGDRVQPPMGCTYLSSHETPNQDACIPYSLLSLRKNSQSKLSVLEKVAAEHMESGPAVWSLTDTVELRMTYRLRNLFYKGPYK